VINGQNVELQTSRKRKLVHSAYRLKKFVDPANSKFLDKKEKQKNSLDESNNKLILDERKNKELRKMERNRRE
jgi:hypothetical protein